MFEVVWKEAFPNPSLPYYSMEQYIVSARKYRPQQWEDVVGQQTITSTLQRAIDNNHLAQAFLFCGPRGVGKTTCARILARAINTDEHTEPDEDFSFNIFELDAASNNKVEDIRHLTDQVRFSPQKGNYKVYIIDEVHMLSQAAFNAFLKTLEEPPPHAIFILATTEKHKIIPTILSRCQIFDFKRITISDMVSHLQYVAKNEGVTAEEEALHVIAEKADGAMRDALSTFDRLISFAGNNLTYKDAISNLNILDHEYYFKVTSQILAGDIPATMLTFDSVLSNGFNGHDFINGLASHFRNLLVATDASTVSLLEVSSSVQQRYGEQAKNCSQASLVKALRICNQADVQYRNSKNQRLLVEVALMRLCALHNTLSDQVAEPVEKKNTDQPVIPAVEKQPESQVVSKEEVAPPKVEEPKIKEVEPLVEEVVKTPTAPESNQEVVSEEVAETESIAPEAPKAAEETPAPSEAPSPKSTPLTVERKRSRTGSLNIADLGMKKEEETASSAIERTEAVAEDRMQEIWEHRIQELFDHRPALKSTLDKQKPILIDDTVIQIKLDNQAQIEIFREDSTQLLDDLRNELKNDLLTLDTPVEKIESVKKAFTSKEKYEEMRKSNPELDNFRDQLGLDLEY